MSDPSMMIKAGLWLQAIRPRTLLLGVTPVFAALLLALSDQGTLSPLVALATLLAAAGIQIGTNLHNDAVDFERGTDTAERQGPPRASAQGWFTSSQVKRAAHLAFLGSFLLGILLVIHGGWPILALGLVSIAAGYAYTSGPRPIAYGPFGEVFALLFFGIAAVLGSYYLQTLTLHWDSLWLGIAMGLPAAAVLLLNNYRDFDTDRVAGRNTLSHVLGRLRARWLYALILIAPLPLLIAIAPSGPGWLLLLGLPMALLLGRRMLARPDGPALNQMLGQTAQYQAVLMLLFGCSLLVAWLL